MKLFIYAIPSAKRVAFSSLTHSFQLGKI